MIYLAFWRPELLRSRCHWSRQSGCPTDQPPGDTWNAQSTCTVWTRDKNRCRWENHGIQNLSKIYRWSKPSAWYREKSETTKPEAQGGHGPYDVLVISVIPALVFSHSDGSLKLFCSICLFIHISYFTLFELLAAFETNSWKAFLITIIIAPWFLFAYIKSIIIIITIIRRSWSYSTFFILIWNSKRTNLQS